MKGQTSVSIKNLIKSYEFNKTKLSAGVNLELELKFKLESKEIFDKVFQELKSTTSTDKIQLSVTSDLSTNYKNQGNYSQRTDNVYITTLTYTKNNQAVEKKHTKERLGQRVQISTTVGDRELTYAIALAKEYDGIDANYSLKHAKSRFKIRASYNIDPEWRADFTTTYTGDFTSYSTDKNRFNLQSVANTITPENFLTVSSLLPDCEFELEYIGNNVGKHPTIESLTIANKIFMILDPKFEYQHARQMEIYNIAKHILPTDQQAWYLNTFMNIKELGNQVKALTKQEYYKSWYKKPFLVTIKAEGERAFVVINSESIKIITSRDLYVIKCETSLNNKTIIADAEYLTAENMIDKTTIDNLKKLPKDRQFMLRVFDVLVGTDKFDATVFDLGLSERIKLLPMVVTAIQTSLGDITAVSAEYELCENDPKTTITSIWTRKYPFAIDGLILSSMTHSYHNTLNVKWKPYHLNTIDFLALRYAPGKYYLCVGIRVATKRKFGLVELPNLIKLYNECNLPSYDSAYSPIQFAPSMNPSAYLYEDTNEDLNGKIIELGRTQDNSKWEFHRIRADRKVTRNYFGNNYDTAEATYINYVDPFYLEDLWTPSTAYFQYEKKPMYAAPNMYKRFVFSKVVSDYLQSVDWIIDEGAGRGGDLGRYKQLATRNVLLIDVDPTAIAEAVINRYHEERIYQNDWIVSDIKKTKDMPKYVDYADKFKGNKVANKQQVGNKPGFNNRPGKFNKQTPDEKPLTIHTLVKDLKTPYVNLLSDVAQFGVRQNMINGIVCNFAFHYMCDTTEHIRNILKFNFEVLAPGGLFIFTVMDGQKVFDLLQDYATGDSWQVEQDSQIKYKLQKNYSADTIQPAGQMISVKLPFTDDLVEEPLCNVANVIAEARRLGFKKVLERGMDFPAYLETFKANHATKPLTDDDLKYIGLHTCVVLSK